jgi:hypothetical protein
MKERCELQQFRGCRESVVSGWRKTNEKRGLPDCQRRVFMFSKDVETRLAWYERGMSVFSRGEGELLLIVLNLTSRRRWLPVSTVR